MKLVSNDNNQLYENSSDWYLFIISRFNLFLKRSIVNISTIKRILEYLIDITLEVNYDFNNYKGPIFIHDKNAIEAYFKILVECFKSMHKDSNVHLKEYVLVPLEALTKSFMNNCVLSKLDIQDYLMKILKRSEDNNFQKQITAQIGRVSSSNTTHKQIQSLLRKFVKKSKYVPKEYEEKYFISLLDILIDCISGTTIRNVYLFSGNEGSYIELTTPLVCPTPGVFWTGYLRYESGNNNRQCIFSFLRKKPNECKGIELYIENRKLIYRLVKITDKDESMEVIMADNRYCPEGVDPINIEISANIWHRITMIHVGNSFQLIMDGSSYIKEISSNFLVKEYTIATIGAVVNPETNKSKYNFFGEISTMYFYVPTHSFKNIIKKLSTMNQQELEIHALKSALNFEHEIFDSVEILGENKLTIDIHFIVNPMVILLYIIVQCFSRYQNRWTQ